MRVGKKKKQKKTLPATPTVNFKHMLVPDRVKFQNIAKVEMTDRHSSVPFEIFEWFGAFEEYL